MAATKGVATRKPTTRGKEETKRELSKISSVADFKRNAGGVMELPSGLIVAAFNPGGIQAFLANGTIPNSLMPIVKEALKNGKAPDPEEMLGQDGEVDPEMLKSLMEMLDSVAVSVIREPSILPKPLNEADRLDTQLYADEIPMEDKQFLMQWVTGGTRDLEKFRQELESGLGNVAKVSSTVGAAQRRAGISPK